MELNLQNKHKRLLFQLSRIWVVTSSNHLLGSKTTDSFHTDKRRQQGAVLRLSFQFTSSSSSFVTS